MVKPKTQKIDFSFQKNSVVLKKIYNNFYTIRRATNLCINFVKKLRMNSNFFII
jgi:hypothetical protein